MNAIIETLNGLVWSWPLVGLCLLAALYFSFGTRFIQVRRFGEMVRLLFKTNGPKKEGISSFQAFALALSGRVGTGNIVGVALAIGYGGPGAIVWMWIIAFLGAGTAFAEATLAQMYKERVGKQLRGGPAYYIEKGLKCRWLAVLFAVSTVLACACCLPPIHSNSIASSFSASFGIAPWIIGICVALLLALVVMGGVKRISKVAEIVTPFMAIAYVLISLVVLFCNLPAVPAAFKMMIQSAFGTHEVLGAILGSAVAWGVKRGIYSNEAGQGTAPIVAAAAEVSHPVKQGLVQGFSVYIDTLLVCTATAVMLLATNCYNVMTPDGTMILAGSNAATLGEPGVSYTIAALSTLLGSRWGGVVVSVTLFFFAFTTIMAYYYYAETNLVYLFHSVRRRKARKASQNEQAELAAADQRFGDDRSEKVLTWVLRFVFIGSVVFGSLKEAKIIWDLGDTGVGVMAWINIVAIVLLSPKVFKVLRSYDKQKRAGQEPRFNPTEMGLEGCEFWDEQPTEKEQ